MTANKYKIAFNNQDQLINIPFNSNWEFNGLSDGYSRFETETIKRVINPETDFEVSRFSHASYLQDNISKTKLSYECYFYNNNISQYFNSYVDSGLFSTQECYYNSNSFNKSFFKLDLYDTSGSTNQKNYITIILPTQQGETQQFPLGTTLVNVRKPQFNLDFIGDKEGFFIYWLKNRDYLNIDTFYMSAKFFDAKNGRFIRLLNQPQPTTSNFNSDEYFYYRVNLNYSGQTYEITDTTNLYRVGEVNNPIKWYEYTNV